MSDIVKSTLLGNAIPEINCTKERKDNGIALKRTDRHFSSAPNRFSYILTLLRLSRKNFNNFGTKFAVPLVRIAMCKFTRLQPVQINCLFLSSRQLCFKNSVRLSNLCEIKLQTLFYPSSPNAADISIYFQYWLRISIPDAQKRTG